MKIDEWVQLNSDKLERIGVLFAVVLFWVFMILVLTSCSGVSEVTYNSMYSQMSKEIQQKNIEIDSLYRLISVETTNYKKEYLTSLKTIDSIKTFNRSNIDTLCWYINEGFMNYIKIHNCQ